MWLETETLREDIDDDKLEVDTDGGLHDGEKSPQKHIGPQDAKGDGSNKEDRCFNGRKVHARGYVGRSPRLSDWFRGLDGEFGRLSLTQTRFKANNRFRVSITQSIQKRASTKQSCPQSRFEAETLTNHRWNEVRTFEERGTTLQMINCGV